MFVSRADWFKLPLKLRQRWWRETDYGKLEPGAELRAAMTTYSETLHQSLPVHGYVPQGDETIALVNQNKILEEQCLQILDALKERQDVDQRWLAIGRTGLEQAWMAINRAIFKPQRHDQGVTR